MDVRGEARAARSSEGEGRAKTEVAAAKAVMDKKVFIVLPMDIERDRLRSCFGDEKVSSEG
jgi:hypothetical protein